MTLDTTKADLSLSTRRRRRPKHRRHIQLGTFLLKRGKYSEALDQFKSACDMDDAAHIDVMIPLYKRTLTDYDNTNLHLMIANIYHFNRQYADALLVLEDLIEINPEEEEIYPLLGKLYDKGDPERVKALFMSVVDRGYCLSSIIRILPAIYMREQNYDQAIQLYRRFIQHYPGHYSYYKTLAELYYKVGRLDEGVQTISELLSLSVETAKNFVGYLEGILQQYPEHAPTRQLLLKIAFLACQPQVAIQQAEILVNNGEDNQDELLDALVNAKSQYPDTDDLNFLVITLYCRREEWTVALEEISSLLKTAPHYAERCIDLVAVILDKMPSHYFGHLVMGDLYRSAQDIDHALDHYAKLIEMSKTEELEPRLEASRDTFPTKYDYITCLLARLKLKQKDSTAALEICNQIESGTEKLSVGLLKAEIYQHRQQYEQAMEVLSQLNDEYPYHYLVHEGMRAQFEQAIDYQMKGLDNDNSLEYGLLVLNKGEYLESIRCFQGLVNKQEGAVPWDPQMLLGRSFLDFGRYDMAIQQFQAALQVPGNSKQFCLAHYYLAVGFYILGKWDYCKRHLDTVYARDLCFERSSQMSEYLQKHHSTWNMGRALLSLGDITFALPLSMSEKKGRQKDTSHTIGFAQTHNEQGVEYALQRQHKLAEEEFIHAIHMDPNYYVAAFNLSTLYMHTGHVDNAKVYLERCKEIDAKQVGTQVLSASIAQGEGRYTDAIACLATVPMEHMIYAWAQLLIGDLSWKTQDIEASHSAWRLAMQKNPFLFPMVQRRYLYQTLPNIEANYWINPWTLPSRA